MNSIRQRISAHERSAPPIQSLWIGDSLGEMERLSACSFLAHGHPYHLYVYSDVKNIPAGVHVMDANEILPEKEIYKSGGGAGYAPFSNWFRWEMLYKKGNYWMDMDMVCMKKLDFAQEVILTRQDSIIFCTAIIKSPPHHPLVQAMAKRCHYPGKTALYDSFNKYFYRQYSKFGIKMRMRCMKAFIASFIKGHKEARKIMQSHLAGVIIMKSFLQSDPQWEEILEGEMAEAGIKYFYPVQWKNYLTLMDDTYKGIPNPFPDSYTVHLWKDRYSLVPETKHWLSSYSPHSFYAQMKQRYLVEE